LHFVCLPVLSFSLLRPLRPRSTLFPYTTLFRSQCLHQSLLNRVTDRRSRSNIWHRTHSSLVGEHTALHTVHDRSTDRTTEAGMRSEEHTSELQSRFDLVCRLLLEKKNR